MVADALKRCSRCGEEKPLSCFSSHHTTRDGLRPDCKPCKINKSNEWRAKNRDKVAASTKRSKQKKPEVFLERQRQHFAKNKEKIYATSSKWRDTNREKVREKVRKWQHENREQYNLIMRTVNARRRSAGNVSTVDVRELMVSQRGLCVYCHVSIKDKYHVDHILPVSLGGKSDKENIQLLCPPCNQQKKDRHPVEFAKLKGLLL